MRPRPPRPIRPHTGDLGRVMRSLTIGPVHDTDARERRARDLGLSEIDEQFQLPIAGDAGSVIAWDSVTVSFDHPFHYAPGQRDSDLDVPQFTYGAVIESGSPVIVSACVTGWIRDEDDDAVKGAVVQVGAHLPGTSEAVHYGGFVHVTFQGYGALQEDETEMSQ